MRTDFGALTDELNNDLFFYKKTAGCNHTHFLVLDPVRLAAMLKSLTSLQIVLSYPDLSSFGYVLPGFCFVNFAAARFTNLVGFSWRHTTPRRWQTWHCTRVRNATQAKMEREGFMGHGHKDHAALRPGQLLQPCALAHSFF